MEKYELNEYINAYINERIIERLDKIKTEILSETESILNIHTIDGMKRAVDIIDKHKSESEK